MINYLKKIKPDVYRILFVSLRDQFNNSKSYLTNSFETK